MTVRIIHHEELEEREERGELDMINMINKIRKRKEEKRGGFFQVNDRVSCHFMRRSTPLPDEPLLS